MEKFRDYLPSVQETEKTNVNYMCMIYNVHLRLNFILTLTFNNIDNVIARLVS